jgi:peptidyl-prolyl cis-trans isomerase D
MIGFGAAGLTGTVRSIGSVDGRDIPAQSYAMALEQQVRNFSQQIGQPLSFAQAQSLGLDRQVLAGLVADTALAAEALRRGLSVGDENVAREIVTSQAFQGLDGEFDRALYADLLQREGLTEAAYEASLRDDMKRGLIQGAVIGGLPAPTVLADTILAHTREARNFTWAALSPDDLATPPPAPDDAALAAYYDANPDLFTRPEQRRITYAWLTPAMIADRVVIEDQAVQDLYDQRAADYRRPEQRQVERLIFPDQAAAEAALARITAGEIGFDALVTEMGFDLADTDLGALPVTELGPEAEAVFAAAQGDVVGPFDSPFGPALFRMQAVFAAEETPFDEVADELRAELAADRARRIIRDSTEGIADLLAGGATLEDLAERTDLDLGAIDWDATLQDGIAAYDAFRTAAAAAVPGEVSALGEFDDGGIFLIRLDEVIAPTLQPLDTVRDQVVAAATQAGLHAAVLAEAERIRGLVATAGSFDLPEAAALTPIAETGVTRFAFIPGTPEGFLTQTFALAPGEAAVVDAGEGQGAVVVLMQAITPPDPTDPAVIAEREQLAAQIAESQLRDLRDAFGQALLLGADVQLDDAAINAVHAAFN